MYRSSYSSAGFGAATVFGVFAVFFMVLFSIAASLALTFVLTHKVYEKAGYSKWISIIPFYNMYILYKMADIEVVFFVLSIFFPVINLYLYLELAKKFGKSAGFGILTFFFSPICLAVLGYGDAVFNGTKNPGKAEAKPAEEKAVAAEATSEDKKEDK